MKTLLTITGGLALAALLLPAQAQTPAPAPTNSQWTKPAATKPATQHGATPKLAPGVDPSVGRKFMEKSKPNMLRTPIR